ncbi:hypothetical protein BC835DRAFT_271332 [Cytidiella melzeri]|nr:hypothetical protein BC835DRAFT_271332 [Cytidiella melzeri]
MSHTAVSSSLIESFKKPVPTQAAKRTIACQQCRKRRLKCDNRRPCSTCLRSHAYLVDHPLPGVPPPPAYPECVYDDVPEEAQENEKQAGYKKLENRISELEALLRNMSVELQAANARAIDKERPQSSVSSSDTLGSSQRSSSEPSPDDASAASTTQQLDNDSQSHRVHQVPLTPPQFSYDAALLLDDLSWLPPTDFSDVFALSADGPFAQIASDTWPNDTAFSGLQGNTGSASIDATMDFFEGAGPARSFDSAFLNPSLGDTRADSLSLGATTNGLDVFDFQEHTVVRTGWSPHLPDPATTRRVVEAFFAFHIHAGRLFHGPSFLASLDLHPMDERFPSVAVLHALCAVGSMFVAEIPPTPIHTHSSFPYVIFHGRWRRVAARPDSFAEQHSKLAQHAVSHLLESGEHIVSVLQAQILLSWFYREQARWSETFINSGAALRNCVPLGLSSCHPFKIPSRGTNPGPIIQETDILPESDDVIEQETRRNIFWLAYAMERQRSVTGAFAMELDDQDINQLLPVRGDQFELGIRVPVEKRQFSSDSNVLLYHPSQQTDSFTMYIKGMMLLSRVKSFNSRYKGRYNTGDPALYSPSTNTPISIEDFDPRDTQAFQEVDHLLSSWKASFPPEMRAALQDQTIDPHLYAALITGHLCVIMLHDRWMDMDNPMCPSAGKVIKATRSILDLMYLISSTSYDVSLLDQICLSGWYIAGRCLIRFLHAAIRHNFVEHIVVLHTEVSYVHAVLSKAGERVPAAYRCKRLISDILAQSCGEQFVDPPRDGSPSAYITPAESAFNDPLPSKKIFSNLSSPNSTAQV